MHRSNVPLRVRIHVLIFRDEYHSYDTDRNQSLVSDRPRHQALGLFSSNTLFLDPI